MLGGRSFRDGSGSDSQTFAVHHVSTYKNASHNGMNLYRQYRVLRSRCSYAGRYVSVARRMLMLNHHEFATSSQSTLNLMVVGHCWFESFHWKLTTIQEYDPTHLRL